MLEKGFTILSLLLLSKAVVPLLRGAQSFDFHATEGDPVQQAMFLLMYIVVAFVLIVDFRKDVIELIFNEKYILILTVITLTSALWSDTPELTLRRATALIGTTLFGIYLAVRYSLREQLKLLSVSLLIAAILSMLFVLALPDYGISTDIYGEKAWRGVFNHKNVLGRAMVLSAIAILIMRTEEKKYSFLKWAGFVLSVGLTVLSTAKAALVITVLSIVLLTTFKSLRWHYQLRYAFFCGIVFISTLTITWILYNLHFVLGALGRDATLSGRGYLWKLAIQMIYEQPVLGYGFGSFWLGSTGKSGYIWRLAGWDVPHAHNGFLDLLLSCGIIGLLVFCVGFGIALLNSVRYLKSNNKSETSWPLIYLLIMILYNITETTIIVQNNIYWVIYTSTVLSLSFQTYKERLFFN